jgi:hypothetical protein
VSYLFPVAVLTFSVFMVMLTTLARHVIRLKPAGLRTRQGRTEVRMLALRASVPLLALGVIIAIYAVYWKGS